MKNWIRPWLELWKHRELLVQFTLRNVELRHKGSHLGLVWSILNPLLLLLLYVFIFGFVFDGKFGAVENESKIEYALGVFVGLGIYHFIAETIGVAPNTIISNPNFVKKVVFPLEVLPIAGVGASGFHALVSLTLALIGIAVFGSGVGWLWLWLPVILAPVVLLGLGLAGFLAGVGVFIRDIGQLVQFLSLSLMFGSAVFYPASQIPAAGWMVLKFNPLIHAIESARSVLLWHRPPDQQSLLYLSIFGLCAAAMGMHLFSRMKPAFADVV